MDRRRVALVVRHPRDVEDLLPPSLSLPERARAELCALECQPLWLFRSRGFREHAGAEWRAEVAQERLELTHDLVRREDKPASRVEVRATDVLLGERETRERRKEQLVGVRAHEEGHVLPLLKHAEHLLLRAVVGARLAVLAEHRAVAAGVDELHDGFRVRGEQDDADLRARCVVLVVLVLHERVAPVKVLLPVVAPQEAVGEDRARLLVAAPIFERRNRDLLEPKHCEML